MTRIKIILALTLAFASFSAAKYINIASQFDDAYQVGYQEGRGAADKETFNAYVDIERRMHPKKEQAASYKVSAFSVLEEK